MFCTDLIFQLTLFLISLPIGNMAKKEESPTWRAKRDKNNIAVKNSREKQRVKERQVNEKLEAIRAENSEMDMKIKELQMEMNMLTQLQAMGNV